jgi:hypothetical protein
MARKRLQRGGGGDKLFLCLDTVLTVLDIYKPGVKRL